MKRRTAPAQPGRHASRGHLADELTLADLARVAAFSPFHFHRLFAAIVGETPFGFIQRVRIERAAGALSGHPDQSVLEVALDHGFASAAAFAGLYRTWLPGSGYEPDDRPCFEVYRARPGVEGRPGAFRCELCLPVRPV